MKITIELDGNTSAVDLDKLSALTTALRTSGTLSTVPLEKPEPEPVTLDAAFPTVEATEGPELDSAGVPWDPEKHASTKTKKADGTWTARRGRKASTTKKPEVTIEDFQSAIQVLHAHPNISGEEIMTRVSQRVFKDMSRKTGGPSAVTAANDPKLTQMAMEPLQALALEHGVTLPTK